MNDTRKFEYLTEKGKLRYVLLYGVGFFGILSATLSLLIRIVIGDEVTPVVVGINYIVFLVVGMFWGLFMWRYIAGKDK